MATALYKTFVVTYFPYISPFVIIRHLSIAIMITIVHEKIKGKYTKNVKGLKIKQTVVWLTENNKIDNSGIENNPTPISDRLRTINNLSALVFCLRLNINLRKSRALVVIIIIEVKLYTTWSIVRSISGLLKYSHIS